MLVKWSFYDWIKLERTNEITLYSNSKCNAVLVFYSFIYSTRQLCQGKKPCVCKPKMFLLDWWDTQRSR